MSHMNPRTGRYADDLIDKLNDRTATVGDVVSHAEEILVEGEVYWGTVVTEPVRLLLVVINALSAGLDVQQNDNILELAEEQK
jgi:hypothetical protein